MRLGGSVMKPYHTPSEWLELVQEYGYSAVIFPVDCTASPAMRKAYLECAQDHDLLIGEALGFLRIFQDGRQDTTGAAPGRRRI